MTLNKSLDSSSDGKILIIKERDTTLEQEFIIEGKTYKGRIFEEDGKTSYIYYNGSKLITEVYSD